MPKTYIKQMLILVCLVGILVMPYFVFAGPLSTLNEVATGQGNTAGAYAKQSESTKLTTIISTVINTILSFLGAIFMVLMIYGGFAWMTAGGDEEKVKKAQATIQRAIIGLVVVVSAYAIWALVSSTISPNAPPNTTPMRRSY